MESLNKIRKFLGEKKHRLQPRNGHVSPPVAQVFIRKHGIESAYTLSNFPSLYSPGTAETYVYDLTIYGEKGESVARRSFDVLPFASIEVVPANVFGGALPELGIFAAGIRTKRRFSYTDRHLGIITPHFYACYRLPGFASVGVIHPQTILNPGSSLAEAWESNQLLSPIGLRSVSLVQMNPNFVSAEVVLRLNSKKHGVVAEKRLLLGPFRVGEVEWSIDSLDIGDDDFLYVSSPRLPAPNGKPLLFCHFGSGKFTASHA